MENQHIPLCSGELLMVTGSFPISCAPSALLIPGGKRAIQMALQLSPWHLNKTVTVLSYSEPTALFCVHQPPSRGGPPLMSTHIGKGSFLCLTSQEDRSHADQTDPGVLTNNP